MPIQPFLPGTAGGGAHRLGRAYGTIEIDTSPLRRGLMEVKRVGREMGESFRGVRTTIASVNDSVSKFRREIAAVTVGAGLIAGFGYREARTLRQYRVTFTQLLGDAESAQKLMNELTEQANRFGIEFTEVWQLGRALLPVLDDGAETLDEWVTRAALLASTNPLKGTTDAVRAIQEYLAGQPRSLQYLFNVDPNLIAEAKQQYQSVGDQLDFILQRMGTSEEAALEMADAFVGVRNEVRLLMAEAFTPLLNQIQPMLSDFRELVRELRQSRPELLNAAAGFIVLTGAATGSMLILNQVLGVIQAITTLSPGLLTALGRAGGVGLSIAGGVGLGLAGSRAIGRARGDEELAQAGISDLWRVIKQGLIVVVERMSSVLTEASINVARAANRFVHAFATMIDAMSYAVQWLQNRLPGALSGDQGQGTRMREWAEGLRERSTDWLSDVTVDLRAGQQSLVTELMRDVFPSLMPEQVGPRELRRRLSGTAGGGGPEAGGGGYTEDQLSAIQQWHERREQIAENTAEQINELEVSYGRQRASVVRDFNKTMAREAEDWARQRMRARRELERNIAEVYESRAEREASWAEQLGKRITQMQDDANRQLQRLQEEHRLTLLDAASRLDARAVAQEQRRYRQRRRQIGEDLERRIRQEKEAHQERLAEARKADEERIEDMKDAFGERQRQEEEDRELRLRRMKEDHEEQLREMDQQQARRISQIRQQGYEERQQLDYEFQQQMIQLDYYQDQWLERQEAWQDASLAAFESWWAQIQSAVSDDTRGIIGGRQAGGPVTTQGLYELHGSQARPEYVLSAQTTGLLQGALGGSFTQSQLVGAVAGGGSSRSVTLQSGAVNIPIYAAPGQSAGDIAGEVERVIMDLFRELVE